MKYAIVYCSNTGNTAIIANEINEVMGDDNCVYVGRPDAFVEQADILFVGFWTDKGNCQAEVQNFLTNVHHKKVFIFGTAGFGGDEQYFEHILQRVEEYLAKDNELLGTYMCQGRMPDGLRLRYEAMLPENSKIQAMIDNFDQAMSHPDEDDIQRLIKKLKKVM